MILLYDSREQSPLSFKHPQISKVRRTKLDVGDYGVRFEDGHEPKLFFERKSIGDLYGTMTTGYSRFKREVERANESGSSLIIIVEGTLSDVAKGYKYSKYKGESMVKKLFTLWTRYNLMTVYCQDRREMARYITEKYLSIGREYIKQKK